MQEGFGQLSRREREVLKLVARGLANKEIGPRLDPPVTEAAVKGHLKRIFLKLGGNSRTAAAAVWFKYAADPENSV